MTSETPGMRASNSTTRHKFGGGITSSKMPFVQPPSEKRNWLFFGDAQAGERSAIIYTVIESCRRHGIDPYEYLRDVFSRLPSATNWQVKDLTPEAWAKARRTAALQRAA
jgi:hypothetical protein